MAADDDPPMPTRRLLRYLFTIPGALLATALAVGATTAGELRLLNVSYDPTREFYREYNAAFERHWAAGGGAPVVVRMSHGGSGAQANAILSGLGADVVSLGVGYDIDRLHQRRELLAPDWAERLPGGSAPHTSTIVFLVRAGNPLGIADWDDLVREGVQVITPNPHTSGGARWNYLAAWGFGQDAYGGDDGAFEFVRALYRNVPVLDAAARAATNTFVQRGIGDAYVTWENEAHLAIERLGGEHFEIVVPSRSILCETPVAVVDAHVDRRGNREIAEAYVRHLYSAEAQDIAARHYYRPRDPAVAAAHRDRFPTLTLFTVDERFGGWAEAHATHFAAGGTFDRILDDLY
jgi:sulfate/thiosulfate transport system substrate-binding protein